MGLWYVKAAMDEKSWFALEVEPICLND